MVCSCGHVVAWSHTAYVVVLCFWCLRIKMKWKLSLQHASCQSKNAFAWPCRWSKATQSHTYHNKWQRRRGHRRSLGRHSWSTSRWGKRSAAPGLPCQKLPCKQPCCKGSCRVFRGCGSQRATRSAKTLEYVCMPNCLDVHLWFCFWGNLGCIGCRQPQDVTSWFLESFSCCKLGHMQSKFHVKIVCTPVIWSDYNLGTSVSLSDSKVLHCFFCNHCWSAHMLRCILHIQHGACIQTLYTWHCQ